MKKLLHHLAAILLIATTACLTGCEEGGPFFTTVEQFINNEGRDGQQFATGMRLYAEREKAKPGALATQYGTFVTEERKGGERLGTETLRFKENQSGRLAMMKHQYGNFVGDERERGVELTTEVSRYRESEQELIVNPMDIARQNAKAAWAKHSLFPGEDE